MGIITSCSNVTIAINPYRQDETGRETFLKAKAMKQIIASETRIMAITAFLVNSFPTEGPMELKLVSVNSLFPPSESVFKSRACSASLKSRDFKI